MSVASKSGVNEKTGVGSLQDRQVIEGKDLRPCHTEYPLPSASAATSTELFAQDKAAAGDPGGCRPARRAAADAGRAGSRDHRVPRPGPLPAGRGLRRCPARVPQRVPGGDRQDDRRAGARCPGRSCAAPPRRSRPGCSAVARDQDERAGDAGDRLVRARPVGPRCRGRARRGAGRPGRDLQVHGVGRSAARSRTSTRPGRRRRLDGITLDYLFLDASLLPDAPRLPGRAGAGRLGHHHRRQARVHRPGAGHRRVRRRLARLPHRPQRPRPALPAAGHQRRRARPDRRDRAGLPQGATPTVSHPPGAGTSWPRSRPGCRPRSRTPTGPSSTPKS